MFKIIDAHSHYMPEAVAKNTAFFKTHWSDVCRHLQLMDESNIEKSLLLYPTSDAHFNMGWKDLCQVYNQSISELISKYEGRFIGAGILPLGNPELFGKELDRIKDLGLKVLSLPSSYEGKFLDDEMFRPVLEFAKDNNMPIQVHSQIINPIGEDRVKDPLLTPVLEYVFDVSMCIGKLMMSGTLLEFEDVDFIFAHYGGVIPFVRERFDNTYLMLRSRNYVKDLTKNPSEYFKNLYLDTSGSKSFATFLCAEELVGARNIVFGSDFPANQNVGKSIELIKGFNIPDEKKDLIFYNSVLQSL